MFATSATEGAALIRIICFLERTKITPMIWFEKTGPLKENATDTHCIQRAAKGVATTTREDILNEWREEAAMDAPF